MKHYYLLIVILATINSNGQSKEACYDASSYLVNAYSHVKESYESNNISHLKYYANRSLQAFKLAKENLKNCDCEPALKLSKKSVDLLEMVDGAETYEDGRFFVKRARDLSQKSVVEIDKCAYESDSTDNYEVTISENSELSDLQNQQLALKEQQKVLELKAEEIKNKLAQQEEQALALKKEQLIIAYKSVMTSHVKTYNDALKIYDCNFIPLKEINTNTDLSKKSLEAIKSHYLKNLKILVSNYLSQLKLCEK